MTHMGLVALVAKALIDKFVLCVDPVSCVFESLSFLFGNLAEVWRVSCAIVDGLHLRDLILLLSFCLS